MNIIFVGRHHGESKSFRLGSKALAFSMAVLVVLMAALTGLGYFVGKYVHGVDEEAEILSPATIMDWRGALSQQKKKIDKIELDARANIDALTLRMGEMQARLLRVDALGMRLTEIAKINGDEFDFRSEPALGGPVDPEQLESYTPAEFEVALTSMSEQIKSREQQLELIDELFARKNLKSELFIAGRPIKWGWMSSPYGYRTDPFTGKRAWHAGVDFAGKEGSDVIAVASGVVTWADDRFGYGNLVEINHGGGYATRYAHSKELLVSVGDVIQKGQVIATMGNTGRSTGAHVHFEVLKRGKTMDPERFVHRRAKN